MPIESFSTAHLDYLQRSRFTPGRLPPNAGLTSAPPGSRRLWHVSGIGRYEKSPVVQPKQQAPLLSEDVLIGLYGYKICLAFFIRGEPGGVALHLGTWSAVERENASSATLDSRQEILRTVVSSLYPAIELWPGDTESFPSPLAGLALGIPTALPPEVREGTLPLDRLIRAMSGAFWGCLILAEPVDEDYVSELRHGIINEVRSVEAAAQAAGAPSPLAQHYLQLLQPTLINLTFGQAMGAWRTGVYLLGDTRSYYRLASVWRGIYSGEQSLPEPVRVWDNPDFARLAANWAMPDMSGPPGPGYYRHPFAYQTLLTSEQLAAYVHLPQVETSGFAVNIVPNFDVVPQPISNGRALRLGKIIHGKRLTETYYSIKVQDLTRHTFVAGVTGAGKTNTIFYLLKELFRLQVPFLVIEPAKTEYRDLLNEVDLGRELRVFTLGNELVAPFRLNPFEVPPGTQVGVHIDLLRSVFTASFGLWTPLPQILEQCLHQIYEDRGWNITTNTNDRLDGHTDRAMAFPTISDLAVKAQSVIQQMGYDSEVRSRLSGALRTRLNSLRSGGKGRMLDVRHSLPIEELLERPTVLEMESMGDDDDKAFLMGVIFILLAEYRRNQQSQHKHTEGLRHVLVIEEAHRLLTNVSDRGQAEEAAPRGKAVETFANLLSEIRAYGQGVIVADQVPVKLAPDIIKNTNLKIAHRVVAQDDRAVLAGAMAMDEPQKRALMTLRLGEAVVFAEGDDAPLLIKVEKAKGGDNQSASIEMVQQNWEHFKDQSKLGSIYQTYPTCSRYCQESNPKCADERKTAEEPAILETVNAFILSLMLCFREDRGEELLKELYPAVHGALQPHLSGSNEDLIRRRCILTHAINRCLEERGAQYRWSFGETAHLTQLLLPSVLAAAGGQEIGRDDRQMLAAFCRQYCQLCQRVGPYYGCRQVCGECCVFRYAVEPLAQRMELQDSFRQIVREDNYEDNLYTFCKFVTDQILFPAVAPEHRRQATLCLVIQQAAAWRDYGWEQRRTLVDRMIAYHGDDRRE